MNDDLPRIVTDSVPGPKSVALGKRLARIESPDTTFISAEFPVFWERARGCLVTDVDGNTFLDATSSFGAVSVGHAHPAVVSAIRRQSESLIHGMGDVHPSRIKVELLEKIGRHSPIPDALIILGQSGSDAVEAALKTAYLATAKPGLIAFEGGYHGLTYGALEPTARAFFRMPFAAQRGRFTKHLQFGCPISQVQVALAAEGAAVGAVIAEPIQGRGGIRIPPQGWLKDLQSLCRRMGALLILDEIYTGWGRTGRLFACEWDGVTPDLICVGKAMGGGMPISAVLGPRDLIERSWPKSNGEALHTSTFLGHPVACAAAIAAIDAIVDEGLADRANARGEHMLSELGKLADDFPDQLVEVRGRGLMIGLECRTAEIARSCMYYCLSRGLIVLLAGDDGSVIEFTPPLTITEAQLDWCVSCVRKNLDLRQSPNKSDSSSTQ
jgi:4-aminobutyrate aminotransferase-like enzyme